MLPLNFSEKKIPFYCVLESADIGFLLTCEEKFNTSYYRSKEQKRIAQICDITKSDVIDAFIELNQRLSLGL